MPKKYKINTIHFEMVCFGDMLLWKTVCSNQNRKSQGFCQIIIMDAKDSYQV